MTIVTEKNVGDALTYLAEGGAAPAEASFLAAEQKRERLYAELYLMTVGAVKERECTVIVNPSYQSALTDEITAKVGFSKAKSRANGADKICSIYQTEKADARAAERVR